MVTQRYQLRVRYAETDAQGIVHHANYPVWFEEGRSEFLRAFELPYSQWEEQGLYVVVSDLQIRYLAPARYEDLLTVETTLGRFKKRLLEFNYRILRQDGLLLAQGSTRHLLMNGAGEPVSLPQPLYHRLEQALLAREPHEETP
ncbi:MAG: acyl-CoA thioesterase [Desulfuromonadaceae bacterium]|nr:acyl-CoA thioesterase [Desulfuromonadaceae bacterium]